MVKLPIFAFIALTFLSIKIAGDRAPCYWTECAAWNEASCNGDEQKNSQSCSGGLNFLVNKRSQFCCQQKKCGYKGNCVPVGCKGANCPTKCATGQIMYENLIGPSDCSYDIPPLAISIPGKKSWCCDP